MNLLGLHHVSAIASSRSDCLDFYGRLLGLSPAAEPAEGTLAFTASRESGGVLSFAVSPGPVRGVAGRGLVHLLQWSVATPAALEFWRRRLDQAGVGVSAWLNGAGYPLALRFTDPDGLEHEMSLPPAFVLSAAYARERTNAGHIGAARTVSAVPPEMRIGALSGIRAYAAASVQSGDLLAGRLGFASCGEGSWRVGTGEVAVAYACDAPPPSRPIQGAGSVRHVAWSCRPGEERAWRQRVIGMGATVSRVIDCDGYRCFFFREPDGVLFGVATRHAAAGRVQPRFRLPQPAEIPPRIARPIGILAAAG